MQLHEQQIKGRLVQSLSAQDTFNICRHFIENAGGRKKKSCWWKAAIPLTLWPSQGGRPETGRYMASLLLWIPDPAIISNSQPF